MGYTNATACQRSRFNRNIGCIEIPLQYDKPMRLQSLIETQDVLKLKQAEEFVRIWEFNRNIGCIEIRYGGGQLCVGLCLIETQDVLKSSCNSFICRCISFNRNIGCIEMLQFYSSVFGSNPFNRNIGCIEIKIKNIIKELT